MLLILHTPKNSEQHYLHASDIYINIIINGINSAYDTMSPLYWKG